MARKLRIKQIATCMLEGGQSLIVLDDNGNVWESVYNQDGWQALIPIKMEVK